MIYTLTINPSIDHVIKLDEIKMGTVNTISSENIFTGGKGINVSRILNRLNIENIALGFISGFTGNFIKNFLENSGIKTNFINLPEGFSRINTKIKTENCETEINGLGPKISEFEIEKLHNQIKVLSQNDILIIAGSLPPSLPDNFYEQIIQLTNAKNLKFIIDSRKNLLTKVLKFNPFLIKPNKEELREIFNEEINTENEIINFGNKLRESGARNVLVSLGKEGSILITESGEIYKSNVPKGILKNSVGAGDSMLAGFVAGYLKTQSFEKSLQLATACGSATAFSEDLAEISLINELYNQIKIVKIGEVK